MLKIICIIPARLESSRLPNKVLTKLDGLYMFEKVYNIALDAKIFSKVYVASHNEEILTLCKSLNIPALKTSDYHLCGSSRVFEASTAVREAHDVVVNLQADQPFLPVSYLSIVVEALKNNPIATVAYLSNFTSNENTVKVVLNSKNEAIYFSRYPVPYNTDGFPQRKKLCHLGLYAYTSQFIKNYRGTFDSDLCLSESLEQLDFIFNGFKINVGMVPESIPEINTRQDIEEAIESGLILEASINDIVE